MSVYSARDIARKANNSGTSFVGLARSIVVDKIVAVRVGEREI
jgi:hypothetical protein